MESGLEHTSRRGRQWVPRSSAERRSRSSASRCAATPRPDMSARVIATAGHVDHGKSTLIKTLTGIAPDRLREERERGMTIDLGFAWLSLPEGGEVGIVDVPGHQDFIRNMLAGVGPVVAVLLVVALDEGVMPQTREHLAILGILGVERGVIALTKRDLVDGEWAALARADVAAALASTPLRDAPMVEVAAPTRRGLDDLVDALTLVPASVIAARLELLPSAALALVHDEAVKVHIGTAEVMARVSLLESNALEPGASGWVQLRLATPVALAVGDRFVVRRPSPPETL